MTADAERLGFVAIGRNEGERLKRCLDSLPCDDHPVVYVDSGSSDGSVEAARASGAVVVELDPSKPFTAARARNEGFNRLLEIAPQTEFVMFIDGDCELAPGFAAAALAAFENAADIGVVSGRCRERNRDATIYNRLCDLEWAGPIGEIRATGGIFMIRRALFEQIGGFDPAIIAAEDDELCIRAREAGARIWRVGADMCFHDAGMTRFGQWWRRAVRAGHAYAQLGAVHGGYFAPERWRAIGWGLVLPLAALAGVPLTGGWSLAALLLYPASFIRTRRNLVRQGATPDDAGLSAAFLTLSKFPNLIGMADYWRKRLFRRHVGIVEYK
ncbi:MAG: glycosyltransferase [Alphaproteobacteria bacterium]|nr:glycosyltransferase [Alphaproteobacteria bacterium]